MQIQSVQPKPTAPVQQAAPPAPKVQPKAAPVQTSTPSANPKIGSTIDMKA